MNGVYVGLTVSKFFCLDAQKIDLINVTLHCWLETFQTMVVSSNIVISLLLN